jgi:hypothetical protein
MVEDEEGSRFVHLVRLAGDPVTGSGVDRRLVASGSSDRTDADGTKTFTTSFIISQEVKLFTGKDGILLL